MAKVRLTDKAVAAARASAGERLELWDEKEPGLCLRVSSTGKAWVFRYRTADGRQPRLTLGQYSTAAGLAWAREKAARLRLDVAEGRDPSSEKRRQKHAAKAQPLKTFNDLADAYLIACETGAWMPKNKRKRRSTIEGERGVLRLHIRPVLGDLRLEEITRSTVKAMLRDMLAAGIGARTNKAQAITRQCFAFAIAEERAGANPASGFAPMAEQSPRTRVLKDAELKAFWQGAVDPSGLVIEKDGKDPAPLRLSRLMAIALQVTALLAQRRGEIVGMRSDELNLDEATWLIPGERMKNGRPHLVPLPPRSVELVKEALALAEALAESRIDDRPELEKARPNWVCVFPSPRDLAKPMRPDSVTHAMASLTTALKIKGASPHDLRRTASTAMTSERLGISPFIRSKVLGHASDTGGGAAVTMLHYDANLYVAEKRRALEAWEGLLLTIVGERAAASNITELRRGR